MQIASDLQKESEQANNQIIDLILIINESIDKIKSQNKIIEHRIEANKDNNTKFSKKISSRLQELMSDYDAENKIVKAKLTIIKKSHVDKKSFKKNVVDINARLKKVFSGNRKMIQLVDSENRRLIQLVDSENRKLIQLVDSENRKLIKGINSNIQSVVADNKKLIKSVDIDNKKLIDVVDFNNKNAIQRVIAKSLEIESKMNKMKDNVNNFNKSFELLGKVINDLTLKNVAK